MISMANFCNQEISNARFHSDTWNDFLSSIKKTGTKDQIAALYKELDREKFRR